MRRAAVCASIVAALGLLAAALAFGDTGSAKDPRGDVKHNPPGPNAPYDIVRIAYGHASHGRLTATVRTRGKINNYGSPGGSPPLLWINVPGKVSHRPGCQYSDYYVVPEGVYQCGDGPKSGNAKVTKRNAHTLRFLFKPKAIGNPSRYGIAFVEEGSNEKGLIFFDRAPDRHWFVHRLR